MPIVAIGGAIIGGIFGSKAAGAQANAAKSAAQLAHEDQQAALDFQKKEWETTQANEAPYLAAGKDALTKLQDLSFTAPTDVTEANDPGYKFRLKQGQDALENSAAARGGLLSGNTAKALEDYTQNYASNEYSNVYGRAFNDYSSKFTKLATLAGYGTGAAGRLGTEGAAAASNVSGTELRGAELQGNYLQNAGAATASGYANWGNQLSGALGNVNQAWQLSQMRNA